MNKNGQAVLVIVAVIIYVTFVAAMAALIGLPELRGRLIQWCDAGALAAGRLVSRRAADTATRAAWASARPGRQARASLQDFMGTLHEFRWPLALAAMLLLLAPTLAMLLRQTHAYDGFDHTYRHEVNEHVAGLLRGEQLVPPTALPPELFTTREVERAHPLASTASRQWELLDAEFRQRLLLTFKRMREMHGYEMVLIEGYRSSERQARLARMGEQVTRAGPNQSFHQFGLAADCAFLQNGRIVISEKDAWAARGYELFGQVAQSTGLNWGGTWRSLVDLGHVELRRPDVLKNVAEKTAAN